MRSQGHGRSAKVDEGKLFAVSGEYGSINESSAAAFQINSMYEGEEERSSGIPQPLEANEESIKETMEEQLVSRGGEPPETGKTETKKQKSVEVNKSSASRVDTETPVV